MEKDRRTSENNNRLWKVMLGMFLVAAVAALTVASVRAGRQDRAQERLEQLAEGTAGGEEGTAPPEEAPAEGQGTASQDIQGSAGAQDTALPGSATAEAEEDPLRALEDMGIPIPEKEIDFAELKATVNPDIYAWIYIPDTLIDYPVLQHPADNLYYLEHNLDGSRGYPGCIYTEDYNARDFSDPNTVVYGHNMKNGTMFAGLHKFEDSTYFGEHPYIYIYTEEGLYVYGIFAAYESGNEHILYNNDFASEYAYSGYLEDIFAVRSMNSNIKEDMEVTTRDRIITLSTCVANRADRRYLVQGVLLNGE